MCEGEDLCVASMINRSGDAIDEAHTHTAFELFQTVEEDAARNSGKRSWKDWCGRYEPLAADFPVEEVFMKDGKLQAKLANQEGKEKFCQLYPIEKNTFGWKGGITKLVLDIDFQPHIG